MSFAGELVFQQGLLAGRAPVYHKLLELLRPHADKLEAGWGSRVFHAAYDRPLLILAALRDEALADPGHPLARALADEPVAAELDADRLAAALARPRLQQLLRERFVQTNETRRAIAWRWPAAAFKEPFTLVDVGCSAGLNLVADALPWVWTGVDEAPVPPIQARLGFDRAPLDAADDADARWLRACVWPGEKERLDRLDEAIAAFRAAPPRIEALDLVEVPGRLAKISGPVLVYQTLVRDYLSPEDGRTYTAFMEAWVRGASGRVWIELEYVDGGDPCGIIRHDASGVRVIAACGYHPTAIRRNYSPAE